MIVNATGGAQGFYYVDFSLSETIDLRDENLVINNVILPSGKVKGFILTRILGGYLNNGTVTRISKDIIEKDTGTSSGAVWVVYYSTVSTEYEVYYNIQSTIFSYDANAKTLTIQTDLPSGRLEAGSYRLVIW